MLMVQLSATMSMIARATVSTAISTFEYTIKKHKTLLLKTIIRRMLVNYLCDLCCTVISNEAFEFFTNSIFSALPRKF
jgi:hypothetical protein